MNSSSRRMFSGLYLSIGTCLTIRRPPLEWHRSQNTLAYSISFEWPSNAVTICTSHRIKGIALTPQRGTYYQRLHQTHSPEDRTRTRVGGSAARRSHSAERNPLHEAPAQSVPFPLDSGEEQGGELLGDVGGGDCSPMQQRKIG